MSIVIRKSSGNGSVMLCKANDMSAFDLINPHSNYDFKIYFKPNHQEFYFYNDIPCFATVIENENNFNNFQIMKNGQSTFNKTAMGFNVLNHEKEKSDIELNKPNLQMGITAINFKSNGSKKNYK